MRYAGIIYDDTAAAPGVCLSFYTQGCPIHCEGCHNADMWDEEGGLEFTPDVLDRIITGLHANGVNKTFCILGGEPLSPHNTFLTTLLVSTVKEKSPNTPIWIWSGYSMEEIVHNGNPHIEKLLTKIDGLVTDPFILAERDITLKFRGSRNQRVWKFDNEKNLWYNIENEQERFQINA